MATEYVAHHLDRVASTQDEARTRFSGVPCLVTAAEQRAGRGRSGAEWMNAPRAVAAGLAARSVLADHLRLKWPNDVVTPSGDKVAGLLAERTGDLVILGLGANLFWPDAPPGVAAVATTDPGPEAPRVLAMHWAESVLAAVQAGPESWGRAEYRAASATIGTHIAWDGGGPGRAVDIDEEGGLVVETAGGLLTLRSGRVRSVRPTTLPMDQEDV